MIRKPNLIMIVAFLTSAVLIAFAFYQRSGNAVALPLTAFYLAAALICLAPVTYALFRPKCSHKTPK